MDKAAAATKMIFTCNVCEQSFATAGGLFRHKNSTNFHDAVRRNGQNQVIYVCNVCDQEFVTHKALDRHLNHTKHPLKKINQMDDDAIDASENAGQGSDDVKQDPPNNGKQQNHASDSEKQDPHPSGDEPSTLDDHPIPSKKIKLCTRLRIACKVCGKIMREDNLRRHMNTKHAKATTKRVGKLSARRKPTAMKKSLIRSMKRKRASKFPDSSNDFGGKYPSKFEEVRMMSSTECAMKTMTNTLHGAFKHIHDETAQFLEKIGIVDASGRVTNVLAPIEEKIAMDLQQKIWQAAAELEREFCNFDIE